MIKNKKTDNSFWNFLDFKGKKGHKDLIFLCCGYLFLVVLLLLSSLFAENEIPIELTYAVLGLPFVFFVFALTFWGLKRFFSFLYGKISLFPFVLICIFLFLIWNGIAVWTIQEAKTYNNGIYTFPALIIWLAISGFLLGLMIWNMQEAYLKASLRKKLAYVLINALVIFFIYYFLYFKDINPQNIIINTLDPKGFFNKYITFLVIHLLIYSMLWILCFIRTGGVYLLISSNKDRIRKNRTRK